MTTANKITIARILLVPFFIVETLYYTRTGDEIHRLAALMIFGLATISDALDGYIARRYNQRSELGVILDPLADKLLLTSAIILLSLDSYPHFERMPLWFSAAILSRDVLVVIGIALIHYAFGKVKLRPRLAGKVGSALQMASVLWVYLHWDKDFIPWLAGSAALLTGISGFLYLWDGLKQLNNSPASSPSPERE